MAAIRVLVVCTANLCRSPMAEGILKSKLSAQAKDIKVKVESRGISVPVAGLKADPRAVRVSQRNGVDLGKMRTRQLKPRELRQADYVLVMNQRHLTVLAEMCDGDMPAGASLITLFASEPVRDQEVPDPYYSTEQGFASVFDLLSEALDGFVAHLQIQK
ncbi:low molecular weight protein-tyrosine-phosphatase [Pseudomaricurvus sp. HS19]|uniref:low molecular weight protein-tyrosine-phosphatase n=1 Tax=Pseudomaricurvus sp. HS19 TaxID=2692626 RepID=UPI00136F64B8|nr:low molecular weight phosphotyrosine protein phosphatase [Pseudomaricurvus sp. HS19]